MIALIFVLLAAITLTVVLLATRTQDPLRKRVRALQFREEEDDSPITPVATLSTQERALDHIERALLRFPIGVRLQQLVLQAGLAIPLSKIVLWGTIAGLFAALMITAFVHLFLAGLAAFCVAAALPYLVLHILRKRRIKKFEAALPDAIQLMARSLRAGHSVSAALEMVGEQGRAPLAEEFRLVSRQQRLGAMSRDTLMQLADRVPSQDLRFLVTAILVQRDNGGDLTEVLDRTAHVISERLRINGEVRIYSAQGRLTGWILSCLPLALLLIISIGNPRYANVFFTDPVGQRMLIGAGVSITIGIFVIRRIVNIRV